MLSFPSNIDAVPTSGFKNLFYFDTVFLTNTTIFNKCPPGGGGCLIGYGRLQEVIAY